MLAAISALGLNLAVAAWVVMCLSAVIHPVDQDPLRIALILFFGGFALSLFTPLGMAVWFIAFFVVE
jgi:hypothetical protein